MIIIVFFVVVNNMLNVIEIQIDAFVKQIAILHPRVEMREHISRGPKVGKTLD